MFVIVSDYCCYEVSHIIHTLTCLASGNPGTEIIHHAGHILWGVIIVPQQSICGKGMTIVAEASLFLILVHQVPLSSGYGSRSIDLRGE